MTRRNQRRMPVATLYQTIEAMMAHFFELIDNAASADHIFKALLLLRRVSKQVGIVLSRDVRTRFYFFFAASTLQERGPVRFLDGTFGVDLFNGAVGTGPRDPSRFSRVTPLQCLSDRLKSAKRLSTMDATVLHSRSGSYFPSDVPSSVNVRVGMLVGRARYMVQRCRQLNATTQCSHCGRVFFTFDTATASGAAAFEEIDGTSSSSEEDDDATGGPLAPLYWDSVALVPLDLDPSRVCSLACHLSAKQLLENVLPETFELQPKKLGFVGVAETARLCMKRNSSYERQLRMTRKRVQTAKESALMRRCVEMLNVDTALCLCAARTAEVRMLREAAMVLPGELEAWRDGRGIYTKQLERIKSLYREHGGASYGKLVTDEHRPPKWLGKCLESSSWLFEGVKK